jgi:hypothetical protein
MTATAPGLGFPILRWTFRADPRRSDPPSQSVVVVPSEGSSPYAPRHLPPWVESAIARLVELSELPAGWDSRRAAPIERTAIIGALQIMAEVMERSGPLPAIIPTVEGGVLLEWHRVGLEMEIEVEPTGDAYVMFQTTEGSKSWDGTWESRRSAAREAVQAMASALPKSS